MCKECYLCQKEILDFHDDDDEQYIVDNDNIDCPLCYNWKLRKVKFQPHIHYPKDSPYYNDLMAAKEVAFDSMCHACYILGE